MEEGFSREELKEAISRRTPCRLGRVGAAWRDATLVEMNESGIVCTAPLHDFAEGEAVRLRYEIDGAVRHFEATVLKVGVPLRDRGSDGLLIGFLSALPEPGEGDADAPKLEVHIPGGGFVSLLEAPLRIVDLEPSRITFEVPVRFTVVFPERGILRLRMACGRELETTLRGRVDRVIHGKERLMYSVAVEKVEDRAAHQQLLALLRQAFAR